MTYTVPIKIRYSDIDMNQHVNNAVYFTYMENARTELLGVTYLFRNADTGNLYAEGKTTLVLVNQEKNKPVRIPDDLKRLF